MGYIKAKLGVKREKLFTVPKIGRVMEICALFIPLCLLSPLLFSFFLSDNLAPSAKEIHWELGVQSHHLSIRTDRLWAICESAVAWLSAVLSLSLPLGTDRQRGHTGEDFNINMFACSLVSLGLRPWWVETTNCLRWLLNCVYIRNFCQNQCQTNFKMSRWNILHSGITSSTTAHYKFNHN